ncbi:lipase [Gordonia crocea]|uniref:Lipase n=2 Tax=Gordonia crocea TaxID=589162 RepID=A0A7M3SVK6_9ACTN|nr:lipase [Gordonia crocea]
MPADSIAATVIPRVRFAAIGDSFTEGVGDPRPDGNMRGWADLVAEGLALAHGEPIAYANFAIRGRLLGPIVDDQLPAALRLDPAPTILTINGGGNDMLRRGCDPAFLHSKTEQAVLDGAASGARVVLLSGADPSAQLPFGSTIHQRGEQLTAMVAEIAARHDVTFVDLFNTAELRNPSYWSSDRLHLAPQGHRRVAAEVLAALVDNAPTPEPATAAATPGLLDHVEFAGRHLFPWVMRRVRGRSSGDGRDPKHPDWTVVG